MTLLDLLDEIDTDTWTLLGSDFDIEVVETQFVPTFDGSSITYEDLVSNVKKCKLLESCVLYVDMRGSTAISMFNKAEALAQVYTAFIRAIVKAAPYFGGHVRNIVGDRVMVLFDREDCFRNAVDTAVLFNSIAAKIIDKRWNKKFRCGIGIDYGKMLITKAGQIRQGAETEFYRSLLWLGRPANIASKLTDAAGKSESKSRRIVKVGHVYPALGSEWHWYHHSVDQFLDDLQVDYATHTLRHKNEYFTSFVKSTKHSTVSFEPILMTSRVFEGLKTDRPDDEGIRQKQWSVQPPIPAVSGKVYGGDITFAVADTV